MGRAYSASAARSVVGCAALGALTNSVNGLISPEYFRTILGWVYLSDMDVWRASIAQGILEGVIFGLRHVNHQFRTVLLLEMPEAFVEILQ